MDITFEHPTPADAQALVAAQIRAFHDDSRLYPGVEIGGPPGYDSVDAVIHDLDHYHCHKIVCDGRIIGGMVVFDWGEEHFHLDRIYIDPDYHNRGIGTRALQFIEETYPAKKWTLDTPIWAVRNQHFYEKMGYVKVGEKVFDDITLISYEKLL